MTISSVIDFENWPIGWRIFACSGWVVLIILNYGFKAYIYRAHLPAMLRAFSSSPCIVSIDLTLDGQGFNTRKLLLDFMSGALKFSPKMIKLGYVSAQDIQNIPRHFKVKLYIQDVIPRLATAWVLSVLTITLIAQKISEW